MTSLDYFFFSAFPYVAIIVFIVGSIYRYRQKGFQVTSLSAQFLEGIGVRDEDERVSDMPRVGLASIR